MIIRLMLRSKQDDGMDAIKLVEKMERKAFDDSA